MNENRLNMIGKQRINRVEQLKTATPMISLDDFLNTIDSLYLNINHLTKKDLDIINSISNKLSLDDYTNTKKILNND